MVTVCDEDGELICWEWPVDLHTREPHISPQDILDIQAYVDDHQLVFHNAVFDIMALKSIGVHLSEWDLHDTLIATHCLNNLELHGLKYQALKWCDILDDDEEELAVAVKNARIIARVNGWRRAEYGDPHFPGTSKSTEWYKLDYWLPAAVYVKQGNAYKKWKGVCAKYGLLDAERTIRLWYAIQEDLEDMRGVYEKRRKLLRYSYEMSMCGITIHTPTVNENIKQYRENSTKHERKARSIVSMSGGNIDNLNSYKQLQGVLYGTFGAMPIRQTKTGYATDKGTLDELMLETPPRKPLYQFIKNLRMNRKYIKAIEALDRYKRYAISCNLEYARLYPRLNPTGTRTTRFSSSDPNGQNVSKQEGFNVRECFQPMPGRVWYSVDYSNIELRILIYESKEEALIKAFESGESVHMLFANIVCPEMVKKAGGPAKFKKTQQYQYVKNGDFSITYGASRKTADATYHIHGAYDKVRKYFTKLSGYMDHMVSIATKQGYITTLGGYRLYTPPGKEYTTAVDYVCQGTAGDCMNAAIVRCGEYLDGYPDHHMMFTIHDELLFDFPEDDNRYEYSNRTMCGYMMHLMEQSGKDIGIPTPTEADVILNSWADGEAILW